MGGREREKRERGRAPFLVFPSVPSLTFFFLFFFFFLLLLLAPSTMTLVDLPGIARLPVGGEEFRWVPYAPIHNSFKSVANKAPDLPGAQTREALAELGIAKDEIDELFAEGAVSGT